MWDYVLQLHITYRKIKILEEHTLIILKIRKDFEIHSSKKITKQVQFLALMGQLFEQNFIASFPPPITTIRAAAHKEQGHPLLPSCGGLQMIKTALGLRLSQNI
jgi:hypothetical protein